MRSARVGALALALLLTGQATAQTVQLCTPEKECQPLRDLAPPEAPKMLQLPEGYWLNVKGYLKLEADLDRMEREIADLARQNQFLKVRTDEAGQTLKLTPLSVALLIGGGLAVGFILSQAIK